MRRFLLVFTCLAVTGLLASPVMAQYPRFRASNPATGESYHVEIAGAFWNPTPEATISSESLGILGTEIDLVADLGIAKTRFKDVRVVLRPAAKHKFRFEYLPVTYTAETVMRRDIVFNGIRYSIGLPVNSTVTWKTMRGGYEYDFLYRDRWFVGLLLDLKYTDVEATLASPVDEEWARARAPIPGIGGVARVYVASNVSITGEFTYFKLPESVDEDNRYEGRYVDFDLYGTVNFTENVGFQAGYRSLDTSYRNKNDSGAFTLKGLYFGGVLRY